jgi:LuxR family maltose regulon positive regulatory protein
MAENSRGDQMASTGSDVSNGGEQTTPLSLEQREPLLRTKFFVPPIQSNWITRSRLSEQIDMSINKALTLVIAPPGYGKTTLVSRWLRETKTLSTWLSLDDEDNDPVRFLQCFITALQKIVPTLQPDLLSVLQGNQAALINILINEISEHAPPFILILDDFQALQSHLVLEIFVRLIERIPPPMHVMLLSRSDPPIPLSRLRVRNQVIEIRAEQLRFTFKEITQFLTEAMALNLSSDDIAALEVRTEGWIAGLQLAAISMSTAKDVHGFVTAFTGSHYYIMDYLAEEVLKLQSDTIRSFLLQSSILDRMCGPLCDGFVEIDPAQSVNGQAILETLEQLNLFIVPLDNDRRWYRYHHLFADVLKRRLEMSNPQLLPDLYRRAARWHEQNGYIFDAIRYTLLAGDRSHAAHLVDQNGCQLLMRGEVIALLHWIEAVEPYSQTLAWIAIQKAWALCLTGQPDRAVGSIQIAEQLISSQAVTEDRGTMIGAITTARAHHANMQGETHLAVHYARQALDYLPVSNDLSCSLRSVATSILGDACWLEGNLAEAQRAYADAVLISQSAGNIHTLIIANSNLAEILLEQGQLGEAARIYSETLKLARLPDGQVSPLIDRVYAGLSKIAYEWNHLEEAKTYSQQCIEIAQRWENNESQSAGLIVSAGVEHAHEHPEKAREAIHAVEQLINKHPLTPWRVISLKAALARLWIAQGDFERAFDLVQKSGIRINDIPEAGGISYPQEPYYLILLHLHQSRGDPDAVLALSEQMLQQLDGQKRVGRVIEILVLRALAFSEKKEIDRALAVLEKALSLAYPEKYIRVFLDKGEPMTRLLYQAMSHRIGSGYATELLSVIGNNFGSTLPPAKLLIEPLTQREIQVLELIEAGCSNQEIAAKFVISIPTVKRHISNIYAKLGTSSRTQAILRGRELELLK